MAATAGGSVENRSLHSRSGVLGDVGSPDGRLASMTSAAGSDGSPDAMLQENKRLLQEITVRTPSPAPPSPQYSVIAPGSVLPPGWRCWSCLRRQVRGTL
jgi:hypothetical protein